MSQPAKGKSASRDPPPSLFLRPSPTVSHVTLPGIPGGSSANAQGNDRHGATAPSGQRSSSLLDPAALTSPRTDSRRSTSGASPGLAEGPGGRPPLLPMRGQSSRATDRTDALWAEMQATLEEVELSASGGTRVFGPDHDRKLGELRASQIALAQAWARSEADEAIETLGGGGAAGITEARNTKASTTGDTGLQSEKGGTAAGPSTDIRVTDQGGRSIMGTQSARTGSFGGGGGDQEKLGAKFEEETEADILLARKRREANDRYFQRVNKGVLDVVAKLEEVAVAMRAVEQESKDIWAEDESVPGSAKS
ncbi:hypothetical protein VTK73DRAFT_9095 [Phialemonium thermophilum]|uniref:Uncharacterized protein n=1 Tax=Phialemonium thermophilum TaxID=223376 RepID=A0ABR3XLJ6_9PEZI